MAKSYWLQVQEKLEEDHRRSLPLRGEQDSVVRLHWHQPHDPLHCHGPLLPVSLQQKLYRGRSFTNSESEESNLDAEKEMRV